MGNRDKPGKLPKAPDFLKEHHGTSDKKKYAITIKKNEN